MDTIELFQLSNWIEHEINQKQIIARLNDLYNVIQQNTQPNRGKQPFENQKDVVISLLKAVPLDDLTQEQRAFLEKMGLLANLGNSGADDIANVLEKNAIDPATAAQKIQNKIQQMTAAINKNNQIKTGLDGCISIPEAIHHEIVLRVYFEKEASIQNVADLKEWAGIWFNIARGITMIHGDSPESVKVVGASRGSIIIELAVIMLVAKTISKIMQMALKVVERSLDIAKKAEEVRGLRLTNDQLAKSIKDEADKYRQDGVAQITATIISEIKIDKEKEGDKITALNTSIGELVKFLQKGGELDYLLPEDKSAGDAKDGDVDLNELKQLRDTVRDIKKLELKVKQLEYQNKEQNGS
ncbi:MAG TPA: hypothetical protein VJP80_01280 [Candidatus Saccharimonadales bacterium]|nr:hypothetical protein [Candidatus Saccharimonadales bacterium]